MSEPTDPGSGAVQTVDVVVLNWNGRAHLETCLEALSRQQDAGVGWQVLVVDNGSTDDSVAWLEETWLRGEAAGGLQVRLLRSSTNSGFCGGNNLAARESTADALVLLNNDTAPKADWLKHLVAALQQAPADVAAVSGMLVDWDEQRVDFVQGQLTFDGHAFQRGFGKPLGDWAVPSSGTELLFACGGNMIIRRRSFLDAGGFDPMYFAYLEDVDLGWRLWSGGERVLFCREAVARHRSMATSDQLGQNRRGFLFERNAFLTAFKNYDDEFFDRLMPAVLLTFLARTRTLLAQNNAGGELIGVDPYAEPDRVHGADAPVAPPQPTVWQKFWGWGPREFARRGMLKLRSKVAHAIAPDAPAPNIAPAAPQGTTVELSDQRSLAQLQAANFLLRHLHEAQRARRKVQSRRQRTDREIFDKFPLAIVATYPGDDELFSDQGFRDLFSDGLPIVEMALSDLMAIE